MQGSERTEGEREILQKAREGDLWAFREIIERNEGRVAATVTGILGPGPEVDDIGQETFIRFFDSLSRFRGDSSLGTYLTRIAINLSLNELKRRKRDGLPFRESLSGLEGEVGDPRERERAIDARVVVNRALDRLDPRFRAVVVLRLINGYSIRETAAILRLPQGTVLSRLFRGQEKLKEIVGALSETKRDY